MSIFVLMLALKVLAVPVDGLVSLGAKGWNCTMPNKSKMAQLCDVLSPAAFDYRLCEYGCE